VDTDTVDPKALIALADLHEIQALRRYKRLRTLAPMVREALAAFEAAERLSAALSALRASHSGSLPAPADGTAADESRGGIR
jgi:hypothetical protein